LSEFNLNAVFIFIKITLICNEQANVQPEPAVPQVQPVVPQVQRLPVPVILPVQQVLQPVPTQIQGVQAEPVVVNAAVLAPVISVCTLNPLD
jgi:hypothetical protein